MPDLFGNVFDGGTSVAAFLLAVAVSLLIGAVFSAAFLLCRGESRSLLFALFFLPSVIAVTIMSVNGNIGAGVAVAGAFSLVRFRSAPGTAKEIVLIFMTMCTGLLVGMGYFGYGVLLSLVLAPRSEKEHSMSLLSPRSTSPKDSSPSERVRLNSAIPFGKSRFLRV